MRTDRFLEGVFQVCKILATVAACLVVLLCLATAMEDGLQYHRTFLSSALPDAGYARTLRVKSIDAHEDYEKTYGPPQSSKRYWVSNSDAPQVLEGYPGFLLHCVEMERTTKRGKTETYLFISEIEIFDARFRFGWFGIGVGSTRAEIEQAYARDRVLPEHIRAEWAEDCILNGRVADAGYSGDHWRVILFFYDENDCVERMVVTYPIM